MLLMFFNDFVMHVNEFLMVFTDSSMVFDFLEWLINEFFIYQIDGNNSIYAGSYQSNSNEVHLIVKQCVQTVLNL